MNTGRYLRGEDRHIGTARITRPEPERDLAHEADMEELRREQLRDDITPEEADEELADEYPYDGWYERLTPAEYEAYWADQNAMLAQELGS